MCKTLIGNEGNLAAYYNCDNYKEDNNTLADYSGNAYDGTLTNMTTADWTTSISFNRWLNVGNTS